MGKMDLVRFPHSFARYSADHLRYFDYALAGTQDARWGEGAILLASCKCQIPK